MISLSFTNRINQMAESYAKKLLPLTYIIYLHPTQKSGTDPSHASQKTPDSPSTINSRYKPINIFKKSEPLNPEPNCYSTLYISAPNGTGAITAQFYRKSVVKPFL